MQSMITRSIFFISVFAAATYGQSSATLFGRIFDPEGAVVPGATITMANRATGEEWMTQTDDEGNYQIAALPAGIYRIDVSAAGFQTQVVESAFIEVGRTLAQDFHLRVATASEQLTVTEDPFMIERATSSVGQAINPRTVQEIPLNGRYFLDLSLLVPGSVTPNTNGFSTMPSRGLGALAINNAGNREETVNYLVNGITLNNQAFNSISFQPSISTVQEFRIGNSTLSAEYGQNSGGIVNIATRSGTSEFHGELFEFLRNDVFDARNFFNFASSEPTPFKRNQFGGNLGGPIVRNKTFFFVSYEVLRQRQGLDLNSLVLSDSQRAAVSNPTVAKLIQFIPRANFADSSGTPRFSGSATAPANVSQPAVDISHNLTNIDRIHGYYATQRADLIEPNRLGNTVPGFGHYFQIRRQIFTLNETHNISPTLVNELRLGFNRIRGTNTPNAQLNPADFGINNGINEPIGLPQFTIAGGLNFGGPAGMPAGRADTTYIASDSMSRLRGAHSLKFGGEYRKFLTNGFARDTGRLNFPSVAAFLDGTADSFSVTLGDRSYSASASALGLFVQDNYKWRSNLTLELGLRYEWNMTPTERYDRFIVFDEARTSLLRVGSGIDRIYQQNYRNLEPRVGFAWDPLGNEKTSIRGGYAVSVDEPLTSLVTATSANPPLAMPLTFTGTIRFDNAINLARAAGLAPQTIDHGYRNPYLQSWNLNLQRELMGSLALMAGYFGSKGTRLVLRRNINQPINGVRPYAALSLSSPILPGQPVGNITKIEGTGNSSYNALWITANKRMTRGLQFNASYTWSKSIDFNSLSSGGVVAQNSYNLRGDRGLSDFDARHRFVINAIYELPFKRNRLVAGWQLSAIVQAQSGSPINIVSNNSVVTGVANTLRPDVTGPIHVIRNVDRWFDTSVFVPVERFGSLGRNVVIGPPFNNTDVSITKNTVLSERTRMQFRTEVFDLFNHANFGQPGNIVGSPNFGRITSTRFPTGEFGSSRQIQFAIKVLF
jgi:Carboxypeptidase regulatory-like domain/TonB dependent receptor